MNTEILYTGIGLLVGGIGAYGYSRLVGNKTDFEKVNQLEREATELIKMNELKSKELEQDQQSLEKKKANVLKDAETEGEMVKKDKMLQAKEHFLQLKTDHEKKASERNQLLIDGENKLKQKETTFQQKVDDLKKKYEEHTVNNKQLQAQIQSIQQKEEATTKLQTEVEKVKTETENLRKQQIEKLEKIAGLRAEEAKEQLAEQMRAEAKSAAMSYINEVIDDAKLTANKEAKRIVVQTIQRVATETAMENTISVFNIENDDIKGRIIGREGRNIRAIEAATGVDIIVDDTPEAIVLSCFDPVRREIARLSLQQLVGDGRIHPARIEEVVSKTKKQIEDEIVETGKRTVLELGIHGLHPELIRMVGRMKYRSSYGQNLLQHSREVANLCAIMAAELGLNVKMAKRAGLLHDIGKVPDDEPELPHAILGMKLAEKYKEKPEVCNAIGAHHDEVEMTSMISPIIQVCDAMSGARPGARREISESYIQRLKDLEALALSYDGVASTYAIQAGRELRVVVESEKISDKQMGELSYDISQKIQNEMTYPGQIKITVIRETRAISYAK